MAANSQLNPLTERQQNLCEYGGTFGVLISLTCLIQHIIVAIPQWITRAMIILYIFIISSFFLLALKKHYAPVLVIISAVFSLVLEYIWMTHYSFSLVVLALFIYMISIIVTLFVEQVPQKLKEKRLAEIKEEQEWAGKL